ncbi:Nucleotide-diphospho-sugar transferase [Ostreococcus tauri]|uniref:Nucleotide-diphospho-sugar transferase n=1 Tax=Ostreococcus tauri TaxID=70448 RepID=A0A096P9A7_OSTTA|nr:Nucleotide-diphospho-sugar transferase [Ostreococcus tauri]CEG00625.1 Nucleotide-diphospho-sugar transferase [Ostreococcus tauri]|eukprot:XP_022840485.1 Nucleotide-diphospho-sugar transferase [Ostreococcus tauri]
MPDPDRAPLGPRAGERAYGAGDPSWTRDGGVNGVARDDDVVLARERRKATRVRGKGTLYMFVVVACASVGAVGRLGRSGGATRRGALGLGRDGGALPANFFGEMGGGVDDRVGSGGVRASTSASTGALAAMRNDARLGVPGLAAHVAERRDPESDDARILVLTKPFEWGMTYLQIASVKRWAPKLLPHITVLTYDEATQKSCEAHRGVDCFFDTDFVRQFGANVNDGKARDAMSWRKVHAALELLRAKVSVVILDSDTVFLSDPTEAWTNALEKYDVIVSSDVGDEREAQGNMNTKMVIFPASARSEEICEKWLEGESRLVSNVNFGEYPEQSFWNYVLVPTNAGRYHIHAMSTAESSNFITAAAGADGTFPGTHTVTASYCGDTEDKEQFLQHILETKHNAEAKLGIGPKSVTDPSNTALPLHSATDFDHDGVADAAAFPHPDLKCDHVKRRLVAEKRFAVTSDRHITWT